MKVLIADTSLPILDRLADIVGEARNVSEIHKAGTLALAWETFETSQPAVVLLDTGLPEVSFLQLLSHIKKQSPATVVIVLSIHVDEKFKEHCLQLGADFFFDKYHEFGKIPGIIAGLPADTLNTRFQ